jgi:ABC-type sulfate transport system permease subunit
MHLDLPIPIWAIVLIAIVIVIPTFVFITGRNAEGGMKGRASHGWSRWRALSQKAADTQARILLTVFYFTVMVPFGIVFGIIKDPLNIKHKPQGTFWLDRKPASETLADAKRQF